MKTKLVQFRRLSTTGILYEVMALGGKTSKVLVFGMSGVGSRKEAVNLRRQRLSYNLPHETEREQIAQLILNLCSRYLRKVKANTWQEYSRKKNMAPIVEGAVSDPRAL
jgi:hypothetical protein